MQVFDSRAFALGGAHSVRFVPVPRAEPAGPGSRRGPRPGGLPGAGPPGFAGPPAGVPQPYFMNGYPSAVGGPMTQLQAATQLSQFGHFTQQVTILHEVSLPFDILL